MKQQGSISEVRTSAETWAPGLTSWVSRCSQWGANEEHSYRVSSDGGDPHLPSVGWLCRSLCERVTLYHMELLSLAYTTSSPAVSGPNAQTPPSNNGSSSANGRVRTDLPFGLFYLKAPPSILPAWSWGYHSERKHSGYPRGRWVSGRPSQLLTQQSSLLPKHT